MEKNGLKPRNALYKKQYFVTLYLTLSSLSTWKLSTMFYESYKSLIIYQKNLNIKDKIKTYVHFDNAFKVNEQKKIKLILN